MLIMDYELKDGKRVLTKEARQRMLQEYLSSLLPLETKGKDNFRIISRLTKKLPDQFIVVSSKDIHRALTASYLVNQNHRMRYAVVDANQLRDAYFMDGSNDVNNKFPSIDLLVIKLGYGEIWSKDNPSFIPDMVTGLIEQRKQLHQHTIIYIRGEMREVRSKSRWMNSSSMFLTSLLTTIDLDAVLESSKVTIEVDKPTIISSLSKQEAKDV